MNAASERSVGTRKRVLLFVDDEGDLGALFTRLLARSFHEVHFAPGPAAAEALLARGLVTHLVVDAALEQGEVKGQDLICRWRRAHPSIVYAAIFSGRALAREQLPPEVDEAFRKPEGLDALLERLGRSSP